MTIQFKSFINRPAVQIVFAFILILAYYFPYIYYGENTRLGIHDNLDSNLSWIKVLLDSGTLFSSPQELVPQVFNGIPRSALYGTYDISLVWFSLFGMYGGYVVNKIVMGMVAFVGMYCLLKKHIVPKDTYALIPFGVALLFSLLPYWSFTLSVCGLPLVLYAFMNIRKGEHKPINWLIIVGFAFYSSLILSGIFFIALLFLIFFYDISRNKKPNLLFLQAIGLLCGSYIISHFPLFYSFLFDSDYISHRTSFDPKLWTFSESLKKLDEILRFGQYHAHSLHTYLIIPILAVLILQIIKKQIGKKYIFCLVFLVLTSIFYGIIRWETVSPFINRVTAILPIQFQRFHFLHPMLWYLLLGLSLAALYRYGKILIVVILLFQLVHIAKQHEFITPPSGPSYKEFYAVPLFEEVKDFINLPPEDYRVISIGIHPSIAQFNGFYTLDGYYPNYPLKHKLKFREVISGELKKDKYLTYYYDNWGSRCYAFTHTLRRDHLNPLPRKIKKLDFNFSVLKKMGGVFLLSSAEIDTTYAKELQLLHTFEHPDSYWKIYLYENLAVLTK
ncbi:MAG: DUF6044 family protein [Saonia sp.]